MDAEVAASNLEALANIIDEGGSAEQEIPGADDVILHWGRVSLDLQIKRKVNANARLQSAQAQAESLVRG